MARTLRETLRDRGWTDEDWTRHGEDALKATSGFEISPARYIEDRDEWEALRCDVRNLLPAGTTVTVTSPDGQTETGTIQDYKQGVGRIFIEIPRIDFTMAVGTNRLASMLDAIEIHD